MNWIVLALGIGCETAPSSAPPLPNAPMAQHRRGLSPAQPSSEAPRVPTCPDGAAATPTQISMGTQALTTDTCTIDGEARVISARVDETQWRWTPGADETNHAFKWVGVDSDGHGYMVLRYWSCPQDGCERATFFRWGTDGSIAPVGEPTAAHAWSINEAGRLEYTEKVGYSAGYSVASASQANTWDGTSFIAARPPTVVTEFDRWICEDTTVPVVDPASGEPSGATVSVGQGDAIEALQIGTSQPVGSLFEYRVNGATFWALNWEQTCAG